MYYREYLGTGSIGAVRRTGELKLGKKEGIRNKIN